MLQLKNKQQTMSSREIAELVESRHDNVKRSMETLQDKGIISFTQSEETSHEGAGARPVDVYLVGKRDSYIVVAQLSPEFTARLVDRWQELEQQFNIPTTLSGALRLAAEQAETIEHQALLIESQKPAVEFIERYVEARSSRCLSDVAKLLKHKPQAFIAMLSKDGVIFKRGGSWIPYQHHIDVGRFTVSTGESNGHAFQQTRVEPDGIVWLASRYPVGCV
jgi:phage regulator Rha-like protein